MKTIPFSKFKLLKAGDLKELKSFKVTSDGDLLCYIVIPKGEPLIATELMAHLDEMIMINDNFGGEDVVV